MPPRLVARQFNEIESLGGLADEFNHMGEHGSGVDPNERQLISEFGAVLIRTL